ncbi:MAG: LysM peptidoglycan-binding domain-containing protein [Anaerolineaceae bacterium]|nr:LysM peptidoglycan-binding domain-containing protein [Anaerolineaceae bacterium]
MRKKTEMAILLGFFMIPWLFGLGISNAKASKQEEALRQETAQTPSPTNTAGVPGFITSTPNADGSVHHIVREGDFPYTIADAYGIRFQELLSLNNLDPSPILQVGQDLLIKKPGSVEMPTATLDPAEEAMLATASAVPPTPDVQALVAGTATAQIATQFAGQIGPGTPYPSATPTHGPGIFARIFSTQARYLGLGVIGIVIFGLVLLMVSAKKMQQ